MRVFSHANNLLVVDLVKLTGLWAGHQETVESPTSGSFNCEHQLKLVKMPGSDLQQCSCLLTNDSLCHCFPLPWIMLLISKDHTAGAASRFSDSAAQPCSHQTEHPHDRYILTWGFLTMSSPLPQRKRVSKKISDTTRAHESRLRCSHKTSCRV